MSAHNPIETSDTKEMIQMCLECPWEECFNCIGSANDYGFAVRFYFKHLDLMKEGGKKAHERIDDLFKSGPDIYHRFA